MPDPAYARLTGYAAFAVVHGLVLTAAVAGLAGPDPGIVVVAASVPLLFAWGRYHADITLNPLLDEPARRRWRIALWCVPWSMSLYWGLYVRPRRLD